MKKNIVKILAILVAFLLAGCSIKEPIKSKSVSFTVLSPMIKISDVGFLRFTSNSTKVQIYNSGIGLLDITIADRVCMNRVCKDEIKFNEEFFKRAHYRGFFNDILKNRPIYSGKNLIKTNCGFEQNLSQLTYKICNNKTFYKDTKNSIKIIIREID